MLNLYGTKWQPDLEVQAVARLALISVTVTVISQFPYSSSL
jgi:hypothetical protein